MTAASSTIVVCNYNQGAFLAEAVLSALRQTIQCQVVVVDDGSTDDSRRLLTDLAAAHPRLEVVLQPNAGQAAAYNAGFTRANGDFVLFLDADDVLEPETLASVIKLFAPEVVKVHFPLVLMDSNGVPTGRTIPGTLASGRMSDGLIRHGLLYPSPPGSGNAYRRSALDRIFPLPVDPLDKVGADFFAIYGAVAVGSVAAHSAPLGRYRLHRQFGHQEALVFGNAAKGNQEALKVQSRYASLRRHLLERSGGTIVYAPRPLDFSVMKSGYASAVLDQPYWSAWRRCGDALWQLLRAIWLQPAYPFAKRLQQSVWAFLVLLAPRTVGFRLARYACDPGSRA